MLLFKDDLAVQQKFIDDYGADKLIVVESMLMPPCPAGNF